MKVAAVFMNNSAFIVHFFSEQGLSSPQDHGKGRE